MATFKITAPDGSTLKISGDTMPTETELNNIFANYKTIKKNKLHQNLQDSIGAVAKFDDGYTFGFGRKVGGLANAAFAAPFDALLTDKKLGQAFKERYDEVAGEGSRQANRFAEKHPLGSLGIELAGAIYNPLNRAGAKYISQGTSLTSQALRSGSVGAGTGGLYALGQAKDVEDFKDRGLEDTLLGGILGTALPIVGQGLKSVAKKLYPVLATAGKETGLSKALSDDESIKILKRGIQASDDVAHQIQRDAPEVLDDTNAKMADTLARLTGRKLDINLSLKNQRQRYSDFISQNADQELFNAAPTRGQLSAYPAQSKFNLPKENLTKEQAQEILRNRAAQQNTEIGGDINHYTRDANRTSHIRTLANTLEKPDIIFTQGDKGYVVKKYDTNGKPFFDFITKKDGKLHTKFSADSRYVDNQLKKAADNVSINGRVFEPTGAGYIRPAQELNNNIPLRQIVVNNKLPNLDDYTRGLSEYQKDALSKAIKEGGRMSTNKIGSLGATQRSQEVLNDMIEASFDKSVLGQKIPTTKTRQLMELKSRLNQMLEPSGIKPYDTSFSKAKNLQNFYELGYNFKPSNTKFEQLGLKTARDRRAFLQGRIAKILDNVKNTKSVAKSIKDDYNTLKKLMPDKQFKSLKAAVEENETIFERMSSLEKKAKNQIIKPDPADRPFSEKWEGLGAVLGSLADRVRGLAYSSSNEKAAQQLLNGQISPVINPFWSSVGETMVNGSITPYLVQMLSR